MIRIKCSIIVPCYNEEKDISRALRSAIDQSMPQDHYEIVVVNDGSKNGTRHKIETISQFFDERRIRVIHHDENRGLPAAKNTGVQAALGMYVCFLDGNDWFLRDALLMLYNYLSYNKELSYVWPDYYLVDERGNIIGKSSNREGSGVLFLKSDLEEVGLFDEKLRVFEEKDMFEKLDKAGKKGAHLKVALYKYVQSPNSLTRGGLSTKESLKEMSKVIANVEERKVQDTQREPVQ